MSGARVPLILGAAAFGAPNTHITRIHTIPECQEIVDAFTSHGYNVFDASRSYGYGTTEKYLAQLDLKGGRVDTKIYPIRPGDHAPAKLRTIFDKCLAALGPHKIRVFYLHSPDRGTPFEQTLEEVNKMYEEGLIEELGLSNFASWEVAECVGIARAKGWIQPTVYEGLYNVLERSVEVELIPCLRKFGLRFHVYSPLAGGLLTGRILTHTDLDSPESAGNRWSPTSPLAPLLRNAYTPLIPLFRELKEVLDNHDIGLAEAALRWLQHHSMLRPPASAKGSNGQEKVNGNGHVAEGQNGVNGCGSKLNGVHVNGASLNGYTSPDEHEAPKRDVLLGDGVIIGVSSLKHVHDNMAWSEKGALPEDILQLIDEVWKKARGDMPHYTFY